MTAAFREGVVARLRSLDEIALVGAGRPNPEGAYPYVGLGWAVSDTAALRGDAEVLWGSEEVQLDVWEKLDTEDGSIARAVKIALDGAKIDGQRLSFRSGVRMDDEVPGSNLVHTVLTFAHRSPLAT